MKGIWRRSRRWTIVTYIVLVLVILLFVVPYLIPLGRGQASVPLEGLVRDNGRFLDIDGLSIYVEEDNPEASGSTIVLIHGFGGSTFSWRHNLRCFADHGYRVISLDLKGFGLSHKGFRSDHSHPAQAELVAKVLSQMGVEQAYIIGHSMGTSVMLHLAHLYPERVLGLISVAGAVGVHDRSSALGKIVRFPPVRRAGEVFLTRYATRERVRAILESAYYRDMVTEEVFEGYYNRIVAGRWSGSLLAMTGDMRRSAVTFPLEDFAFPTLIIWGEHDAWISRAAIDRWRDRIPSARFEVMPGVGHLPMEEAPDQFNGMVLEFLESVSSG